MAQETGNRLILTILKQTERVVYFCSVENVSPNLAVHEFRKSFKRIRALLHFFDDYPEGFPVDSRIQIQKFGRILAPLRESFINIQIFERITANQNFIPDRKLKTAKDILIEKNKTLNDSVFFADNSCGQIMNFIQTFSLQVDKYGSSPPSVKQLISPICISYLKSHTVYQTLGLQPEAGEWHVLRKRMKRLWYQLDFVKYLHPRYFKLKSDQLNKITEQLGEEHDLSVFLNELKSGQLPFDGAELKILENQVEHQRELNLLKLMPRLKQFFTESPELFNLKMEKIFRIT